MAGIDRGAMVARISRGGAGLTPAASAPVPAPVVPGWHFIVRLRPGAPDPARGWVAYAKRAPFVADGHALKEGAPLWFVFGASAAAVREAITGAALDANAARRGGLA
jgi:hypothetical protein